MAKNLNRGREPHKGEFQKRSRGRRDRLHAEKEAESLRARVPRRNDLLPDVRLVQAPLARLSSPKRRVHKSDERHVQEVMTSLQAFGASRPILIAANYEIIDGQFVVEAAHRLGLDTVPAIIVDHLDETEIRLFRLAINRLPQKATWDLDSLQLEFAELIQLDAPIELSGFSLPEIDQVLFEDEEDGPEAIDFEPDRRSPAVTRAGDLWHLGNHAILNGNALVEADYERLLQCEMVRLTLTDMPYNVPVQGHITCGDHEEFRMASGEMSEDEFLGFIRGWMGLAMAHTRNGGLLGSFIDWRGVEATLQSGRVLGMTLLNIIVWNKTNAGMGSLWRSQHELLPFFKVGVAPHVNNVELGANGRWRSNVWTAPGASSLGSDSRDGLKLHPTVKPTTLLEDALLDVTHPGDAVLDPFLGSGSLLLAAERTGRRAFGIELDERYVDVAIRRWQLATGRSAILAETGETFSEVEARRSAAREGERPPKPLLRLSPPASQRDS